MALEEIAGVTTATVGTPTGAKVLSVNTARVRVSGRTLETKTGKSGVHGFKSTPLPGRIVIGCSASSGVTLTDIREWARSQVTVQVVSPLAQYTLIGRRVGDEPELDVGEGEFELEFEGNCEETV